MIRGGGNDVLTKTNDLHKCSLPTIEILFFHMLNIFFMMPPKSMTKDVYLTPIEENLH